MRGKALPPQNREMLLNFHGRHPGVHHFYANNTVRGSIVEVFKDKDDCSVGGFVEKYFDVMGASHFCLVTRERLQPSSALLR